MAIPGYFEDLLLDKGMLFMWILISGSGMFRKHIWYVDLRILSVSLLLASQVAILGRLVLIVSLSPSGRMKCKGGQCHPQIAGTWGQ